MTIESAKGPVQARYGEGCAEARADRVFSESVVARKVRRAHACGEGQPGKRLELVVEEEGRETAGWTFEISERWISAAIIEHSAETLAVGLIEAVDARPENYSAHVRVEAGLSTGVVRAAIPALPPLENRLGGWS